MKRYCLRKKGAYPSQNGPPGDTIWELDEQRRYVRSLVGWRRRYDREVYVLHCKGEDGHWRKDGEINDRACSVRIRDVDGLLDSQKRAIERDLAEGLIDGLY